MKRPVLWIAVAAVLVLGGIFWAVNAWEYQQIGESHVRRHLVRGVVEIERGGRWEAPFVVDPRAPLLTREDLKRIKLSNLQWGDAGLLCATATVSPGKPLNGRLVFVVQIRETKDGARIRDRGIRQTIAWPGGATVPFVLPTDLFKPIRNQQTLVHLETIE
ncbi:hypothetical protein [Armatimonas rosea]|uniref:Uncharacterized protein n=1 Tax=Armatimonas rosea TaxID=685828 RepID=A0A7W9SS56_ARMRO|nr:hypothetical protein [Armatimonas rosea]MBB6050999.1 hypothetical protein [Armatimonas rosea]